MNSLTRAQSSLESSRCELESMLTSIRQSASSISEVMRSEVVQSTLVLRTVASLLEDGLVLLDKDSRITIFNPSASSIFGISAIDAIGKTFDQLFPSLAGKLRNAELVQDFPGAMLDTKTGEMVDLRVANMDTMQDGFSPFRVLLARRPHQLEGDQEFQNKLDEAMDLYSMTMWNFPLVVFATDMEGNNIRGSREFYTMVGLTPNMVNQMNIADILPREYAGWYYQEDAKSEIQITLGTAEGVKEAVAHKSVVRSSSGNALGFITCLTRQPTKSTEASFASSFIKTLDALENPIMLVSFSEARILIVNKAFCAKYGYQREHVLNKGADFILDDEEQVRARRRFAVILAAGAEPTGYFRIRSATGELKSVHVKAIAVKPEGASPTRLPKYCLLTEC